MRTMYDSVNPSAIPVDAQMVAGYIDGTYVWSAANWARFPNAIKVRITVFASVNDGDVLDVENGDATPVQAVSWVSMRRAAGQDPTVYTSQSEWPQVQSAFTAAGVAQPHYWIAAYPGFGPNTVPNGAVAHQYADPPSSGGDWDLSAVLDYWPGVDQVVNSEDTMTTPIFLTNATTRQRAVRWPDGSMQVLDTVSDPSPVITANGAPDWTISADVWQAILSHSDLIDQHMQSVVQIANSLSNIQAGAPSGSPVSFTITLTGTAVPKT